MKKKPDDKQLISVSAYAKLRGISQQAMSRRLARVDWVGKVDVEEADSTIEFYKSSRSRGGRYE